MAQIRACTADDMQAVARLFQITFRDRAKPPPASLPAYLTDVFLEHPWYEPELGPRVYVDSEGAVRGFIGVVPLRMRFAGQPIRAAVAGSLMVERPEENPLAGARLLRSFITGPQDLSISETANPLSQGMWERLGGRAVPLESMEWLRVFYPAGLALALAAERLPATRLARPLAVAIDSLARRAPNNPFAIKTDAAENDVEASDEMLVRALPQLAAIHTLHPDWDARSLAWLLAHAAQKSRYGTLHRRIVQDRDGALLGCYLYYCGPRRLAIVLQILARRGSAGAVIDSLLAHAFLNGSVGVRGRTRSPLVDALLRRHCLFFHRSSTVVHSNRRELLAAVASGDALMTGLAGEAWMRTIGDTFS